MQEASTHPKFVALFLIYGPTIFYNPPPSYINVISPRSMEFIINNSGSTKRQYQFLLYVCDDLLLSISEQKNKSIKSFQNFSTFRLVWWSTGRSYFFSLYFSSFFFPVYIFGVASYIYFFSITYLTSEFLRWFGVIHKKTRKCLFLPPCIFLRLYALVVFIISPFLFLFPSFVYNIVIFFLWIFHSPSIVSFSFLLTSTCP